MALKKYIDVIRGPVFNIVIVFLWRHMTSHTKMAADPGVESPENRFGPRTWVETPDYTEPGTQGLRECVCVCVCASERARLSVCMYIQ